MASKVSGGTLEMGAGPQYAVVKFFKTSEASEETEQRECLHNFSLSDCVIKDIKRQARLAPNLPEKLKLERERKNLETKRDEAWRDYETAAKEIEARKDALIGETESKLKQNVNKQKLFVIRWQVK